MNMSAEYPRFVISAFMPFCVRRAEGSVPHTENPVLAARLRRMADILALQQADTRRVAAYRRAADMISALQVSVDELARAGGVAALAALTGIDGGIAAAILEMVTTGRWSALERLLGTLDPEELLSTLPGIGPGLARRLHQELQIETLEELEDAVRDGRLRSLRGVGEGRAQTIGAVLADRLGHHRSRTAAAPSPPVALLLDVDREYRAKAWQGVLPTIAPKPFNPSRTAWLPVLHTQRDRWHFTVLFSNTARAHALGRIRDCVVIHYQTDATHEAKCTVVTETSGELSGRRVVRGREDECRSVYALLPRAPGPPSPDGEPPRDVSL
jgi:Holliday junction resolvasome RuvABC DNA-binding subunit